MKDFFIVSGRKNDMPYCETEEEVIRYTHITSDRLTKAIRHTFGVKGVMWVKVVKEEQKDENTET